MNSGTAATIPLLTGGLIFLLIYAGAIRLLFSPNRAGRRRRWLTLDWVWVPLGGLAGLFLLVVWWRLH